MTLTFPRNIQISAGATYSEQFSIKNADQSPLDLTGYTVYARLAKHGRAVNAVTSTSTSPVWRYIDFTTQIDNAVGGGYSLYLDAAVTAKLQEGKYVYSITLENTDGDLVDTLDGLAFVKATFGYTGTNGSLDPNYP